MPKMSARTAAALVVVLLTVTTATGLAIHLPREPGEEVITVGSGGYYVVPDFDVSSRQADLIAFATVTNALPASWNHPPASAPATPTAEEIIRGGHTVMTPYRLEIDQVLKGTIPDGDAIHLLREGGRIGNVRFVVEDDPYSLEPGMRVLVFLRDCGEERAERFDTPAGQYRIVNRLTVTRDGDLEIAGHRYARSEVLGTVEAEKDLEPAREVPC